MVEEGCTRILAAPLYPQYCAATTATANDAVFARAGADARGSRRCARLPPYYDDPLYIEALAREPVAAARRARVQAGETAAELPRNAAADAGARRPLSLPLPEDRAAVSEALDREVDVAFQSRFGRAKWLEPATDATLAAYPKNGVTRVAVAAPGFSADCLETLEELGIRGRETFVRAGGEQFALLDCLNDSPESIAMLERLIDARTCRLAGAVISASPEKRRGIMARVAIVTGGTRGIGEAISIALKDMGMKVAANYAGNEQRAREFTERTGIPAYKWDVADFDACQEGVKKVEAELARSTCWSTTPGSPATRR